MCSTRVVVVVDVVMMVIGWYVSCGGNSSKSSGSIFRRLPSMRNTRLFLHYGSEECLWNTKDNQRMRHSLFENMRT